MCGINLNVFIYHLSVDNKGEKRFTFQGLKNLLSLLTSQDLLSGSLPQDLEEEVTFVPCELLFFNCHYDLLWPAK